MKRFIAFAGLVAAAAITLTNCQPQEFGSDQPSVAKTMKVYASTPDGSKTINDGMSTVWSPEDSIQVFYGAGGTYTSLGKFTLVSGENTVSGTFSGEAAPDGTYDYYALYPYDSHVATPASTSNGYINVGYYNKGNHINQDGYDSKAHLRYKSCPMYGMAPQVSASEVPIFDMKQLSSVVEFNVTNNTGAPFTLTKVEFEASEPVTGTFYIDVTASPVAYVSSGDSYVCSTPAVNIVGDPGELAAGATAHIYLPIKPYVHDGSLKVTVSGTVSGDVATKTFEFSSLSEGQRTFTAGKIKPINLNVNTLAVQTNTVAEVLAGEAGQTYVLKNALVTLVYAKGFFVQDATGTLLVYTGSTAPTVSKGDKVDVSGEASSYSGIMQLKNPTVSDAVSSGNAVTLSPVAWTASEVNAAAETAGLTYVKLTMTVAKDDKATIEGVEHTVYAYPATSPEVALTVGAQYEVTGYERGFYTNKSGATSLYFYIDSAKLLKSSKTVVFDFSTAESLEGLGITPSAEASSGIDLTTAVVKDDVSITPYTGALDSGKEATPVRIWTKSEGYELRAYNGNALVVAAPEGYSITKVAGLGSFEGKCAVVTVCPTSNIKSGKVTVTLESGDVVPGIGGTRLLVPAGASSGNSVDIVLAGFASAPSLTAAVDGAVKSASVSNVTKNGATVTFAVDANTSSEARTGTVTVKSGSYEGVITVVQKGIDFSVSKSTVYVDAKANSASTLTVRSDASWTATLSGSDFTLDPDSFTYTGESSVQVTVKATSDNTEESEKTLGSFVITRADNISSEAVTVVQRSAKLATPVVTLVTDGPNSKITASWAAVPNASGYKYKLSTDTDYSETTETSVEFTGLTVGTTYTVCVIAKGDNAPYLDSDEASAQATLSNGTTKFKKVSAISEGEYLFVYAGKAASGFGNKGLTVSDVTINGDTIAYDNDTQGYAITVTADGSAYTLKLGSKYIGYSSSTTISSDASASTDSYRWTIEIQTEGAYIVNVATNTRYIGANDADASKFNLFKAYSNTNLGTYPFPVLYKKVVE